jgi:hypothetical protein
LAWVSGYVSGRIYKRYKRFGTLSWVYAGHANNPTVSVLTSADLNCPYWPKKILNLLPKPHAALLVKIGTEAIKPIANIKTAVPAMVMYLLLI